MECYIAVRASLVAQLVKSLPAMWEIWVQFLGWEDLLEKGKATQSSILTWRIPWTVWSIGSQRVGHDWVTFTSLHIAVKMNYFNLWKQMSLTNILLSKRSNYKRVGSVWFHLQEHHKLGRWDVRSQDSDDLGLRETRAEEWAQGQHLLVLILSIF